MRLNELGQQLGLSITNPETLLALTPREQSDIVRSARIANLLGTLAHRFLADQIDTSSSPALQDHLTAGLAVAQDFHRSLTLEVRELSRVLSDLDVPVVFLKGAAYALHDLAIADGRLASDVDILVPFDAIAAVEQKLIHSGWREEKLDDYDQQYYRQWMHEIPPLRHHLRLSVVDVHHNILPRTSRWCPDPAKLWADVVQSESGHLTLSPVDMILHNCVHLYVDGDLINRLREVCDFDGLVRHNAEEPDFFSRLAERTLEMRLGFAMAYAVKFAKRYFDTPIPDSFAHQFALGPVRSALMAPIIDTALPPQPSGRLDVGRWLSGQWLYLRSHYLRMPLGLLIAHLARQAWRRGGLKRGEEAVDP